MSAASSLATSIAPPSSLACFHPGCGFAGSWSEYLEHAPTHALPHPLESREVWLASRRTFIGASEVAAVVGANPYDGPLDVWAAKIEPKPETPWRPLPVRGGGRLVVPSTQTGALLERHLLDDFARRHGVRYVQPSTRRHAELPWLAATPDADVEHGPLVQVKVVGAHVAPDWDDGPPIYTLLQVQTEMAVWRRAGCTILAMVGSEIREYDVDVDPDLMGPAIEICAAFWPYVRHAAPPVAFDLRATKDETFKRLWPRARQTDLRRADHELVQLARAYDAARAAEKAGMKEKEALGTQIKALVGAELGFYWGTSKRPDGKVTWANNEPGVDKGALVDALLETFVKDEAERLEWIRRFTPDNGSRTLRVTVKEK